MPKRRSRQAEKPSIALDCADDFDKIADTVNALWLIWDSLSNGTLHNSERAGSA